MGFWDYIVQGWNTNFSTTGIINPTSQVPSDPRIQFMEFNGNIEWYECQNRNDYIKFYQWCSPLSSIINYKSKCYAGGKVEVLNPRTLNYVRGEFKQWEKLFAQPNPLQSGEQFFDELYTYRAINGFTIVLKMYAVGFNDVPSRLWNLPFWCLEFGDKYGSPYNLTKEQLLDNVYFVSNGQRTRLKPEDLILITDNVNVYDERTWLPKSRISLLKYPITTCLSAVEGEITMIQKRGALGIISPEPTGDAVGDVAYTDSEKAQLQADFQRYGLSRNNWQQIIANRPMKYLSMTFPTKDLLLQESFVKAHKELCFAHSFPVELSPFSDQSTYNNKTTSQKDLYQDAIMPESCAIDTQLVSGLGADIVLRHDYSTTPALQQSEEEKGKGLDAMMTAYQKQWDLGLVTRNQILESLGIDTVNKEEFNKYKFELTTEQPESNGEDVDKIVQ